MKERRRAGAGSVIFTVMVYVLLYLPILVMILYSFNSSKSMTNFTGFSLRWYAELFSSGKAFEALRYSLVIALLSALAATLIGTLAAYGIFYMRSKTLKRAVQGVTNIPMMNPDIVTGISMLLLFAFIQVIFGMQKSLLGFGTLLIAHITFNIPYVILSVLPKLKQTDRSLTEAALDLGCTPAQSFFRIELPSILPGIISGALMAFTLSLDDFVISNFTIGNSFQTLPILIYSMTKREVKPDMNALCSIVFVVIFVLLLVSNLIGGDGEKKTAKAEKQAGRASAGGRSSFVAAVVAVAAVIGASVILLLVGKPPVEKTLNVYNWGEYISDGSEDSLDVIEAFEDWYYEEYGEKVRVNYTTYASNEDLYNKLSSGAADYDVIIPSDYMIAKLADEGMLEKLDFSLIPNYANILDDFKGLYYDPESEYSVPYTYGVIGIIYNTGKVDEADVTGWELMSNPKYSGKLLQINNPRDAFGIAMYELDLDVNTKDAADWEKAFDLLAKQKPLVQSYVMDEIYNKMESGEAYVSAYYAGDYLFMYENNEDLGFYQPDSTNFFIDAMCIPKNAARDEATYELANIFINFMLSEEPAVANAEMICYASPNRLVIENEEYIEYMTGIKEDAMEILYPEGLDFKESYEKFAYRLLDTETNGTMNSLWSRLKISSDEEGFESTNIVALVILAAGVALWIVLAVRKKKRAAYY